ELVRLLGGEGERLLAHHVLAGVERGAHDLGMRGGGGADVDDVDRRQQLLESAVRGGPRFSGELLRTGEAVAVQLRVELDPARQVGAGDPAGADDADAAGRGWGGAGWRPPLAG